METAKQYNNSVEQLIGVLAYRLEQLIPTANEIQKHKQTVQSLKQTSNVSHKQTKTLKSNPTSLSGNKIRNFHQQNQATAQNLQSTHKNAIASSGTSTSMGNVETFILGSDDSSSSVGNDSATTSVMVPNATSKPPPITTPNTPPASNTPHTAPTEQQINVVYSKIRSLAKEPPPKTKDVTASTDPSRASSQASLPKPLQVYIDTNTQLYTFYNNDVVLFVNTQLDQRQKVIDAKSENKKTVAKVKAKRDAQDKEGKKKRQHYMSMYSNTSTTATTQKS
jgi:hypothetical protein